jgi:hypothetical protein
MTTREHIARCDVEIQNCRDAAEAATTDSERYFEVFCVDEFGVRHAAAVPSASAAGSQVPGHASVPGVSRQLRN